MDFRFTLNHSVLGSKSISQPDGWKGSKIELERHKEFYSLIEHYEGNANGAFVFYGSNNVVDGGVEYIKTIERIYGPDENIEFEADFSDDDVNYDNLFTGLLDLPGKTEMVDNRMQVPVIRESFWVKFINRMDTPVDLNSLVDLDGNAVSAVTPVTIDLPCQLINQYFRGYLPDSTAYVFNGGVFANGYIQIDFDDVNPFLTTAQKSNTIDEVDEHVGGYPIIDTRDKPNPSFELEFPGDMVVNNLTIIARHATDDTTTHLDADIDGILLINGTTEYALTRTDYLGSNGTTRRSRFIYTGSISDVRTIAVCLKNDSGSVSTAVQLLFDDQVEIGVGPTYTTQFDFYVKTAYQDTDAQGYLIHDVIFGVLQRLGLGDTPFHSEFLGSTLTNSRAYASNGCGWMYSVLKGLQIRQYDLTEKPFFVSFNQIWKGINPLLNLGLGYEIINGINTITIEEKEEFFDETCIISFDNVRDIESSYDKEHFFKKIRTGFGKWESESTSGIDDTQTKHAYATRFIKTGEELNLESDFIAASLAIEKTRRSKKKKTQDYKFDNDIFIIALNETPLGADNYTPELDENFNSITGLLNSETRYNTILTPLRSLLRWANLIGGCLQKYATSSYKFVEGQGNYDMVSDYSCAGGNQCQAVICDSLAENADISLASYNSVFGYLFYPMEYKMNLPMTWDQFLTIKNYPKKAIAVSQTDENHFRFFIKKISYDIVMAQAEIVAWPKGPASLSGPSLIGSDVDLFPDIEVIVPPYVPVTGEGPIERSEQDSDDDSTGVITPPTDGDDETFFRILEDGDIRKTENGDYRILEDGAILASERYFDESSDTLYFYEESEIPPADDVTFFEEEEF